MMNAIPENLYDKVWVRVETNYNTGCSWATNTAEFNCQYLRTLVTAIQGKGKNVGIYSSLSFWNAAFHSLTACTDFSKLPLWYLYNDGD